MTRVLFLLAALLLANCTGETVAEVMPGTPILVNGNHFTVQETARGVTVRNFETGRTDPALLIVNAGLAAERVTGCTTNAITKDSGANTYVASVTCPTDA